MDPLDGGDVISIARPTAWSDSYNLSRVDGRKSIRSEIATKINLSARTAYADPLSNAAARAEQLMAEAARLRALSGKEARVMFAGFDEVMQFESFTAQPNDGWDYLELTAQCRRVNLPGTDEAEVTFKAKFSEDPTTGEVKINVSGSIEAPDITIAHAKADAILAAYRTLGRRVLRVEKTDSYADGEDAEVPEWLGIDFDFELAENTTSSRYTLEISYREAADGNFTIYSGTAAASDLSTVLNTIDNIAGGKHPVESRSDLTVKWETDDQGTLKLVSASFSREYQTASLKIRGTLKREVQKGNFGDWTVSVSGSLTAPLLATARTTARGFIDLAVVLRTDSETEGKAFLDDKTQFATLDFAYAWATAHTQTSMQYTDREAPDYTRMLMERTISGTVWAASKSTASTQITLLLSELALSKPVSEELVASHERVNATTGLLDRGLSWNFSRVFHVALTGVPVHDLIEASWSIQRIGMVDHEPMTEVPQGKPIKQIPFGHNIGRLIATGSAKARLQKTARDWGQGKRDSVTSANGTQGAEDPPDERMTQTFLPFSGTVATFYEFSFTYAFRYADGLTGIWSSGLTL